MTEKKYNVLDPIFHDITSQCIRYSEEDKKCYNKHLKQVLDCIECYMKEDDIFKCLYRNKMYTGSFYENLRISKPDEFDINLIFYLPASCQIKYNKNQQPGFVEVKIKSLEDTYIKKQLKTAPNLEKVLKNWIDRNGFLMRDTFMQWMQGVFNRALNSIKAAPLEDTVIKPSSSGPAFTVFVSHPNLSEYSIDLVPVFEFSNDNWPPAPVRKLPKNAECKEWIIVPKPPPDVANNHTYWRMSFYKQEREIMNNLKGMKHIIKLMKLFREKHSWKFLSSYAIKTMFLWENEMQKEVFWQQGVSQLFIHMLQRLSEKLSNGSIPFYWDKELNLLSKVDKTTMGNVKGRIAYVIKQVDANLNNNPEIIKNFFKLTSEQSKEDNNQAIKSKSWVHERHVSNCQSLTVTNDTEKMPFITSTLGRNPIAVPNERRNSMNTTESLETFFKHPMTNDCVSVDECSRFDHNKSIESLACQTVPCCHEVLSTFLEEQREMKQCLLSIYQQNIDLINEIKQLRLDNVTLRKHLQNASGETFVHSPNFADSLPASLSFKEEKCSKYDNFPVMQPQLPRKQNATKSAFLTSQDSIFKNNLMFSDLLESFNTPKRETAENGTSFTCN